MSLNQVSEPLHQPCMRGSSVCKMIGWWNLENKWQATLPSLKGITGRRILYLSSFPKCVTRDINHRGLLGHAHSWTLAISWRLSDPMYRCIFLCPIMQRPPLTTQGWLSQPAGFLVAITLLNGLLTRAVAVAVGCHQVVPRYIGPFKALVFPMWLEGEVSVFARKVW